MEVYGPWPPSNPHVPSVSHIFAIFAGEISLKSTYNEGENQQLPGCPASVVGQATGAAEPVGDEEVRRAATAGRGWG